MTRAMGTAAVTPTMPATSPAVGEAALVAAARGGDRAAFEAIMRRHNRQLFRTARAILRNEADAEEAVQEAYLKAFLHLDGFAGGSQLSTWLVKITVNEALGRLRRRMPGNGPDDLQADDLAEAAMSERTNAETSPEAAAAQGEIRRLLEAAIDALPQAQRTVFMLRAVEEFSTEDTASCLGIPPETVKTRLHRARQALRRRLQHRVAAALGDTFPFAGARCDRVVATVLSRLGSAPPG